MVFWQKFVVAEARSEKGSGAIASLAQVVCSLCVCLCVLCPDRDSGYLLCVVLLLWSSPLQFR